MKETFRSLFVGALALAVSVAPVTPIGAQEKNRSNQAVDALLAAQRTATAESILVAKEKARGEAFDASIRASLKSRMETLSLEQLVGLAQQGADANLPQALGSYTNDLVYTPVTPCRVFDSRPGSGGPGPIPANGQWNVFVAGSANFIPQGGSGMGCGVPLGATSAIINFVAVAPSGAGDIRAWAVTPGGMQLGAPLAAVLNYGVVAGLPAIANGVAVPLCDGTAGVCSADLRLQADTSATNILGDVVGYFRNPTSVPGAVVTTVTFSGQILLIPVAPAVYVFTGQTATVTVAAGQRLVGVGAQALGLSANGPESFDAGLCYQVGAGTITNFGPSFLTPKISLETKLYTTGASVVPGAGTFTVGTCVRNYGPSTIGNNDFNQGWIQVLNQ